MKNHGSTKDLILKTTEALFAIKGFSETKISDISSALGIADSTLYEHFQNKEDILFTIPKENTEKLIHINERHLRGLIGAEVKLRKLIWNYLEFLSGDRDYTSILLFELRSSRDFYDTENHTLLRTFTQPYREAIVEGQNNQEFRDDISPSLILNLIFGTIDLILITWLLERNPQDPLEMFDDFFDLLKHAIKKQQTENTEEDKKKKILSAAAMVFSQLGFNKARIQDIARLAGLGDATIYKYFSSKEEMLFSLPIENTKELLLVENEHLTGIKDPYLKVRVLITNYIHYLDSHKEYSSVCLFDLRFNRLFYRTDAYNLFRQFSRIFYDAIRDGILKQTFRPSLNPYIGTKMIFGLIDHVLISSLKFGRPTRITSVSDQICTLVLNSVKV